MDTKTELTDQNLELCRFLKKKGVLDYSAGNAILSFNGNGSEVTVKFEKFISERFRRREFSPHSKYPKGAGINE